MLEAELERGVYHCDNYYGFALKHEINIFLKMEAGVYTPIPSRLGSTAKQIK
jgi:hypothetical protein